MNYIHKKTKFDYLIIGGGIAGTTAAENIRRKDDNGCIGIISDEPYNLYSRVMLSKPNVFLGKVPFDSIELRNDSWYAQNKIALIAGKKAARIDPRSKTVELEDSTVYEYGKLLLAIGTSPIKLPVEGADLPNVHYLRTRDDAEAIIRSVKDTSGRAVVIGGGFIGFEMCDMLRMAGREVTMLIRENYYWQPLLDETSGRIIERALKENGVDIQLNTTVSAIVGDGRPQQVVLNDRRRIDCGMLIIGIGGTCQTTWLKDSGIQIGRGILADEYMSTNLPDVWVAGDAAEYKDRVLGEQVQMGNWVNAQEQGRIAAFNMTGNKVAFEFISFYTTQGFKNTIAFVGDVRPESDKSYLERPYSSDQHTRLVVKDARLVGATLINRTQDMAAVRNLIKKGSNITKLSSQLTDVTKELSSVLR